MKTYAFTILSVFLSLSFCLTGFAAGGRGNVEQLGEKLYVWHFDEGAGKETKDATAGLVGQFHGDVTWTEGVSNKAVQMAGSAGDAAFIEIPHSDEIDMDEAVTMMAWIYLDELPAGGQENKGTIFYKNTYYLQVEPGAGQLAYYFYDTDNPGYHISDGKVKAREWTHVALVWNGAGARFYINGEPDGKVIMQKGVGRSSPNKTLRLGGENNACCPRFFQGRMDEVMLANYPLTTAEIQKIVKDTLDVSARGKLALTWAHLKM